MSRKENYFIPALEGKKIPILTLDHRWHQLFTQKNPSPSMKRLEEELNNLMKKQGKLTDESAKLRKIKSNLMDEIVSIVDTMKDETDKERNKKLEKNKKLINECNVKLDAYENELYRLPKDMNKLNYELMLETMEICYGDILANNKDISDIATWIDKARAELKDKIVEKQQREQRNQELYAYMHNIFGADVIDIFDIKYLRHGKKEDK